jgi:GNAT superfamily N-acetyltransferase
VKLHRSSLPDSLVSELGSAYTRSFYRYVTSSPQEVLVSERGVDNRIVAGAVLSFDPHGLNRRLLLGTSLALHGALRFPKVLRLALAPLGSEDERGDVHDMPELLLIYAASEVRSRGIGARLVERIEQELRDRGVKQYQVKTVADPANRALAFYDRLGFTRSCIVAKQGKRFQVFTKSGL